MAKESYLNVKILNVIAHIQKGKKKQPRIYNPLNENINIFNQ